MSQLIPPPDREWLPQLYAQYKSISAVASIASLTREQAKKKLKEFGVEIKPRGRPKVK